MYQGPPMENEEISDILYAAKERLFEKGWMKGLLGSEEGPNCLAGALCQVTGEARANYPNKAYAVVNAVSQSVLDGGSVALFNDHCDTTFDDIIDAVDKTIKALEEKGTNDRS